MERMELPSYTERTQALIEEGDQGGSFSNYPDLRKGHFKPGDPPPIYIILNKNDITLIINDETVRTEITNRMRFVRPQKEEEVTLTPANELRPSLAVNTDVSEIKRTIRMPGATLEDPISSIEIKNIDNNPHIWVNTKNGSSFSLRIGRDFTLEQFDQVFEMVENLIRDQISKTELS